MKTKIIENSSNIAALAQEGDQLGIQFKNGGIYIYHGVPEDLMEKLAEAPSVGKAVHELVKGPGYRYERADAG